MSDQVKNSNKRKILVSRLQDCRSEIDKDCITAELSIIDSRLGNFDSSKSALNELKKRNSSHPNGLRSAWFHLADGLFGYFFGLGEGGSDGIRRALALSLSLGIREIQALSSAWMAQIDYSALDVVSLGKNLRLALESSDSKNHAAYSRAYLVGAQALHYSGNSMEASQWYSRAKYHASIDRDDLTIGAILHNMAWIGMMNIRKFVLEEREGPVSGRLMMLGVESMDNYEAMTGDTSWAKLKPMFKAQALSLLGRCEEALELYDVVERIELNRLEATAIADRGWCFAMTGDFDMANDCVERALSCITGNIFVDDRASIHARVGSALNLCGRLSEAANHSNFSRALWGSHSIIQRSIFSTMCDIKIKDEIIA